MKNERKDRSKAITRDIPYLDLMVFFARYVKDFDMLESLLSILAQGFQKAKNDIFGNRHDELYVSIPERQIPNKTINPEFVRLSNEKMHFADYIENHTRLGLLLRIGEYLTYDRYDNERETYGSNLRRIALEKLALSHSSVAQTIQNMSKDMSMDFFKKLESLDSEGLVLYFPDKDEREFVRGLIKRWCYVWDEKEKELLPIKLNGEVFTER